MNDLIEQKPIPATEPSATERMLGEKRVDDTAERVRFQQEYAIQGFRTLTLINGGAIIALLTYLGNKQGQVAAQEFAPAFILYAIGLALSVVAYLFAYYSQEYLVTCDMQEAYKLLKVQSEEGKKEQAEAQTIGERWGKRAVLLVVASLVSFLAGSSLAMWALT